jgi:spore germination protein
MNRSVTSVRNRTYSLWQQTSLITSTLIGVGVLTLPRTATSVLYEAGWISPLLGSLPAIFTIWMIARLSQRFPGMTFVQYSPIVFGSSTRPRLGKWISVPLVLVFLLIVYVTTAITSRIFGEVVVTAVLLDTPLEVIIISMFVLAFILCQHDEEVVARVNELLLPLIVFPVLFIAIVSFQKAEWNNLLPLFRASGNSLVKGALEAGYSYEGYEIMLIYYAFAQQNSGKVKAGMFGIGIALVVYTLIVVAGISVFGYEELQKVTWPTLELVKTTKVPGLILERLESAFLAVWVAAVFTTVANVYYAFILGLRQLLGRGMVFQRVSSGVFLIPLFFIALWPENIVELFTFANFMSSFGMASALGIPVLHWIVLVVRGMWREPQQGGNLHG